MKPREREDRRYLAGSDNPIDLPERVMLSLLPDPASGRRLLDVGCGVGTISLELQRRGFRVSGIDFSSVGVKKARAKGIEALLCDVDASGIPFEDHSFDVIWAGDVLEHLFDPISMLEEVSRILKPGGKALISTPNDMHSYSRLRQCKHHTVMSSELLEYMLNTSGFSRYSIGSIAKLPTRKRRHSKSRLLGSLFGRVFIAEAYR
jgi:2-polyprenyl-3-methyl-5-hydroxy-6-metoxy-1,4-benzoquinol methylase